MPYAVCTYVCGEKSNKCNQCDYASSHAGDFRRHLKTTAEKIQTNEMAQSSFRTQCKETFENTPKHKSNLSRPKFHYSMPACVNQIQKHVQVGTKVSLIMQVEVHLSNSPVQELSAPQNIAILHKCQNQLCIMYINHFYVVKVPLGIKYLQVCITDFLFINIQVIHFLVQCLTAQVFFSVIYKSFIF